MWRKDNVQYNAGFPSPENLYSMTVCTLLSLSNQPQIINKLHLINFQFYIMYIAVYTMHCTIIYQRCDKSSNSLVSLWTFTNELVIASYFVMKKKHVLDSHMQMGILADHWLLFWQVIIFSPMSSNPNWHSKRRTSPFRKPLPSW